MGAVVAGGCSFQEVEIRLRAEAGVGDATGAPGCFVQQGAAPVCPSATLAQPDAMRPAFRVTHLRITAPVALTSAILQNTINDALHRGKFLWGVSFDLSANTVRTGALNPQATVRGVVGQGLIDGQFRYHASDAPTMGGAATRWDALTTAIAQMGDRVTTGTLMGTVRLPIYDALDGLLMEFPLENARLVNVLLTSGFRCIGAGQVFGGSFDECRSNWQTSDAAMMPYGAVRAVITVAAARAVRVEALNTTLCNLLAGQDCSTVPEAMWPRQPDAMAGGQPGYSFAVEIAAMAARVR